MKQENALEHLCSEVPKLLGCVTDALNSAPAECLELYKKQQLTTEYVSVVINRSNRLCTEENIPKLKTHMECLVGAVVQAGLSECGTKHPGSSCSSPEMVECSKQTVTSTCGDEAGTFIEETGNSFQCNLVRGTSSFVSMG
jgi:hypothetical protein